MKSSINIFHHLAFYFPLLGLEGDLEPQSKLFGPFGIESRPNLKENVTGVEMGFEGLGVW